MFARSKTREILGALANNARAADRSRERGLAIPPAHVTAADVGFIVRSQTQLIPGTTYRVVDDTCTCYAFVAGRQPCKHVWAVRNHLTHNLGDAQSHDVPQLQDLPHVPSAPEVHNPPVQIPPTLLGSGTAARTDLQGIVAQCNALVATVGDSVDPRLLARGQAFLQSLREGQASAPAMGAEMHATQAAHQPLAAGQVNPRVLRIQLNFGRNTRKKQPTMDGRSSASSRARDRVGAVATLLAAPGTTQPPGAPLGACPLVRARDGPCALACFVLRVHTRLRSRLYAALLCVLHFIICWPAFPAFHGCFLFRPDTARRHRPDRAGRHRDRKSVV